MRIVKDCIRLKCPYCEVLLEVSRTDVVEDDTGCAPPYSCVCLECGRTIAIQSTLVPKRWRED